MVQQRSAQANNVAADLAAVRLRVRDEDIVQALVTAGALVATSDGRVDACERNELVSFIDQQDFAPTIPSREVAKAFDDRVRQLEERTAAGVIVDSFRPLAGQSLASLVVRTAELVAAADRMIHPGELRAIRLIRLIMTSQHDRRPRARPPRDTDVRLTMALQSLPD